MARQFRTRRALAAMAVTGAAMAGVSAGATLARAETDTDTTTANVTVSTAITLSGLTDSFTLSGAPGDTPTTGGTPVTMTVTTNNFAGYSVTVEPAATTLDPAISGNTDTIATTLLQVRGPAQAGSYTALTPGTPLEVATKASASAEGGDSVSNDYRITIPFVRPDTYTGTLNYVATTL
jgi:hypothetical protein